MVDTIPVRMAINAGRLAMRSPPSVGDGGMGNKSGIKIGLGVFNELLKLCDLSNLLESENLALFVSVNRHTRRIIPTVLKARKTCQITQLADQPICAGNRNNRNKCRNPQI